MYDRWIVEGIDSAITISIGSNRRRLVTCGWLSFDGIGDSVVIAVEVDVVSSAIAISVNWRSTELIPRSVTIGIGKSSCNGFLGVDNATAVGVGSNCNRVATFEQIAYAIVVAVDVTRVRNSICLLYTSPSPRDATLSRMPSSA